MNEDSKTIDMRQRLYDLLSRTAHYPCERQTDYMISEGVVALPCKVGDEVWVIRNYHSTPRAQKGRVDEMFFCDDMSLCIVVRYVGRGLWGKKVFATKEDAEKAIELRKEDEGK